MTDEERLEEIKNNDISYLLYGTKLKDYWEWLIEQAERVQELEEFKQAMEDRYKIWHIGAKKSLAEKERLEQQNKRYRETLEFYANRDNYKLEHFDPNINDYMSTVDYDEGRKARQTIGSEANEIANKALEGDAKE